jgi:hypothetical protein
VTNTAPTAAIDKSSTSVIGGLPTIIVKKNVPVPLSGRSLDPGSDDLSLSWSWGDGPSVPDRLITSFNNAPTNTPDPHPSPSVNPRDVTDATTHAFADACTYTVVFNVSDDDLGSAPSDSNAIIVTGNATDIRGAGYWQTQYSRVRPQSRRRSACAISPSCGR